jgi:hypothetical protein
MRHNPLPSLISRMSGARDHDIRHFPPLQHRRLLPQMSPRAWFLVEQSPFHSGVSVTPMPCERRQKAAKALALKNRIRPTIRWKVWVSASRGR